MVWCCRAVNHAAYTMLKEIQTLELDAWVIYAWSLLWREGNWSSVLLHVFGIR